MSRMPGIGNTWLEKYKTDVFPKDYFHIDGKKHKPPRYYDSILQRESNEEYERIKELRKKHQEDKGENLAIGLRGYHKENYRKCITKRLERKLENEQ